MQFGGQIEEFTKSIGYRDDTHRLSMIFMVLKRREYEKQ
jgi:hypothetical protein